MTIYGSKLRNLKISLYFCGEKITELKTYKTTTMESKIIKAFEEKGAMRPGDIATATGIAKEDVSKTIKKMVADGTVYSPKRCFYDLKK